MSLGHALVADQMIFPIIDGFDELPEALRAKAVEKINHFGSDHGLVVTSRPEEYEEAASALGRGIARAAVVEVLPLRVIEVKQYLSEATAVGAAHRWEAVFGLLDAEPDGPLARVLCTPLMLWLARTVYEPGAATPTELTDSRLYADANSLEKHLLDAFISAVYDDATSAHRPHYRFESADRWLGFLAQQHQTKSGLGDLAWWLLCAATPIWSRLAAGLRTIVTWNAALIVTAVLLARHGLWRNGSYVAQDPWTSWIGGPLGWKAAPELRILAAYYQEKASVELARYLDRWWSFADAAYLSLL
jgi:hypothetical protein